MNWLDFDAICRGCIEGQFMNMKKQIEWMNITYDIIYLTGGASVNNDIAQIISNIFQATVKRLQLVESVSLGAAMRAANICLGLDMNILENKFCNNIYGSTIINDINTKQIYNDLYDKFNILCNKYIK
jgi:sugar (pentulose or hexulose) kinase